MHGLDFAQCQTGRARGRFEVTVTRAALDLRNQFGAGRGRNVSRLSEKEPRKMGHEKMLEARQTCPTEKGKRPRPDLGDKNRSPDFLLVPNLDCDVASPSRQFERQKKSALSRFGKIGVSGRD